jgi:putative nucleotidyltransferase with HDIG domain
MYTQVSYARAEATFAIGNKSIYYELTVWPLYNARKQMTGRIYISHDITALKELEQELRKLNTELEDRVRARTWELAEAYDTTLEGWARALELRDKETEGHSRRVTKSTLMLARKLELPEEDIEQIRRGAILHDIGKMSIPDEILRKADKLTNEERLIIQKHPQTAFDLLSPIPFLKKALEIPYSHHEKWDGTGYPQGLKGRDIPLSARIFAIADVWDALSSDRPYNQAWPREKTIAYFIEQSGIHFDPYIVNLFLGMVEKGEI